MKTSLPFILLFLCILGCLNPRSSTITRTDEEPIPTMDYVVPKWTRDHGYITAHYQVRNTSNRTLEFIKTTASFYDGKGNFIKSEELYISKYTGLRPGEISTGEIMTQDDSSIKTLSLEFTCKGTHAFQNVTIDARQVPKL